MSPTYMIYRARQFWHTLWAPRVETEQIRPYLTPTQIVLFRRMQPSEQWHALSVLRRLKNQNQDHPALLTAALMHDVGKILYPLALWERVVIVVGKGLFPRAVAEWSQAVPGGLRRPFVIAARHAEWGAELAERAGAARLAVALIRRHQQRVPEKARSLEDRLLCALQSADNSN